MIEKKMLLPTDSQQRKAIPITEGVLDYFPLAIAEVAKCSHAGNEQHHPGSKLHWDKSKSTDHANCIGRHLIDRGTFDTDGVRHSAKLAWRALALLQTELEDSQAISGKPIPPENRKISFNDFDKPKAPNNSDDWIQWEGSTICPVSGDTLVEFRLRGDDDTAFAQADGLVWGWATPDTPYNETNDIMEYRICK